MKSSDWEARTGHIHSIGKDGSNTGVTMSMTRIWTGALAKAEKSQSSMGLEEEIH
jgi:hypothetical protein